MCWNTQKSEMQYPATPANSLLVCPRDCVRKSQGAIRVSAAWNRLWYFIKCHKQSACSVGSIPGSGRFPVERNGYPLQYSCQENSGERGAWQTTVRGVSKSQTPLGNFHFQVSLPFTSIPQIGVYLAPFETTGILEKRRIVLCKCSLFLSLLWHLHIDKSLPIHPEVFLLSLDFVFSSSWERLSQHLAGKRAW